ncbi:hypothetical protein L1887_22215 [Cichorium endivia]|nr:hypothetical protein L1887_22215 [Cichorium endivia]
MRNRILKTDEKPSARKDHRRGESIDIEQNTIITGVSVCNPQKIIGFENDNKNLEASSSSHVLNLPRKTTPLLNSKSTQVSSQFKTFANIFIAIVDADELSLPYTFKRTGYTTRTHNRIHRRILHPTMYDAARQNPT